MVNFFFPSKSPNHVLAILPDRGMTAQGFDLSKNVYNNRFQPYIAYWGLGGTIFFTLVTGFEVFFNFNVAGFLTACRPIL